MPNLADGDAVYRLLTLGLIVAEHSEHADYFIIVRPASVPGSSFRGCVRCRKRIVGRASLLAIAPKAILRRSDTGWLVDISSPAAPGPGPIWFHEEFATCQDAVDAIEGCYFGNRVDNNSESLERWFEGRPS